MFDLPVTTSNDQREYRRFRKFLIESGFMMMQESVYSRLVLNTSVANTAIRNIRKNKPPKGLVQLLMVTEKQYSKMEFIVGESNDEVLNTDERVVIY